MKKKNKQMSKYGKRSWTSRKAKFKSKEEVSEYFRQLRAKRNK